MDTYIFILEIIGTIAFASSGAMVGVRKQMDILGVCVLGMTTAVGGGMIRDLILGVTPPVMFQSPVYALVAIAFSILVFVGMYFIRGLQDSTFYAAYDKVMTISDSVGLGIFTVVGVNAALNMEYETTWFLQIFVGMLTGVGGGALRDVMAGDPPNIFVKQIYATASMVGAIACILVEKQFGQLAGMLVGAVVVFLVRTLAVHYDWNLPKIHLTEE